MVLRCSVVAQVTSDGAELALTLLVTRVFADDHDVSVPADNLALVTDLLDAGVDLHRLSLVAEG